MKQVQEILNGYISSDELREAYNTPFTQDGYVVATNGHILIRIPEGKVDIKYEKRDKPNVGLIFVLQEECDIPISFSKLKKMYDDIPEVDEEEECEACSGDGKVEYEFVWDNTSYTLDEDCPVCDGSGYLGKTGKKVKDPEKRIKIGNAKFSNRYIKQIIDTMQMFEFTSIRLVSNPKFSANIFNLDEGIQIILMPVCDDRE